MQTIQNTALAESPLGGPSQLRNHRDNARTTSVAVYARISTADGRQETENQLGELRRFAERSGWEIVDEYVDHESGGKADRAEFRRLFTDAAQGRFDLVLFWALDRFSREGALRTLQHLSQLDSYGIGFRSFTESYIDTCGLFKDAVIAILAAVAKQERVRISERVQAGLARARVHGTKSGKPVGRPRVVIDACKVLELRGQSHSWRQIAHKLGAKVGTVRRVYAAASQAQQTGASSTEPI